MNSYEPFEQTMAISHPEMGSTAWYPIPGGTYELGNFRCVLSMEKTNYAMKNDKKCSFLNLTLNLVSWCLSSEG